MNQEKQTPVLRFPFTFKANGSIDNECPICGICSFDHLHEAGKSPKEFVRLTTDSHSVQEVNESMETRLKDKFPFFFCIHQSMILDFVNSELALQKKQILDILVDEINIANTHNQPSMRITSAYNRISELK
jgi:hypothetical protein